jgi:hypothetical protein
MQPHDLRCTSKLHAVVVAPGVLEVACRSRFCGWTAGKVVLHRFQVETGKLLGTTEYKTIEVNKREE